MEGGEGKEKNKVVGEPGGRVAAHPVGCMTLFLKPNPLNGKVVTVYWTLTDLLSVANSKLSIKATSVYNGTGGLIDDIALTRDDDVLFVCERELFIDPQTKSKPPEGLSGSHTDSH